MKYDKTKKKGYGVRLIDKSIVCKIYKNTFGKVHLTIKDCNIKFNTFTYFVRSRDKIKP